MNVLPEHHDTFSFVLHSSVIPPVPLFFGNLGTQMICGRSGCSGPKSVGPDFLLWKYQWWKLGEPLHFQFQERMFKTMHDGNTRKI